MTAFQDATEIAVKAWARDPHWEEQTDDPTGGPEKTNAGKSVKNTPVLKVDIPLRENLRFRKARITIPSSVTVSDGQTYEAVVRSSTASISTTPSSDKESVLESLEDAINDLKLDVRAVVVDSDGNGTGDVLEVRSNHTALTVDAVSDNNTYSVTIEGEAVSYTAGSSDTIDTVTNELVTKINGSISTAKAFTADVDDDGDDEVFFIRPVSHGNLDVSISGADTTKHSTGREDNHPDVDVSPSPTSLDLDLDAAELGLVRVYGRPKGESDPADGWRQVAEFTGVSYRGFAETIPFGGYDRAYVEITNPRTGDVRSIQIGYATLE